METHPLNLAHQQHRRADAHLINNRYDEAMQCHHNAAELLLDAMKSTNSSVAIESITLQHSYHLKQKDLIKSKKEQYARVKKAIDHLKFLGRDPTLQCNDHSKIQVAIYRALNETDALLNTIPNKRTNDFLARDVLDGKKSETAQDTVTEELHHLNENLHSLVEQLVCQVEMLKDENGTLKERVNYLEKERVKYLNLPLSNNSVDYIKENIPVAILPPSNKTTLSAVERLNQQPHFDLSALKDD